MLVYQRVYYMGLLYGFTGSVRFSDVGTTYFAPASCPSVIGPHQTQEPDGRLGAGATWPTRGDGLRECFMSNIIDILIYDDMYIYIYV